MRGVVIANPETVADPVDDVPDKAPVGVTGEGAGPVLPPERGGAAGQLGWEASREVGSTPLEHQEIFRVGVCIWETGRAILVRAHRAIIIMST